MNTTQCPEPELRKSPYKRAVILSHLGIPGTDPWISLEELIRLGKKASIGALVRSKFCLTNHLRQLDEQAAEIAEALRNGNLRSQHLWHFSVDRHAITKWALSETQAELTYLQTYWRTHRPQRRPHYTHLTENTNAWRHM